MKKIYLALLALTLGVTAQAQRNIVLNFEIVKPIIDTNLKTGSTLNYVYKITNASATAADSVQVGDTVKFFDPSCTYDPTSTATIKFTSYVYFVATTSIPKGSAINLSPTTPLAFASINTLADKATLAFKVKPFTANTQYYWFVQLYAMSKPTANIAIASLAGTADTQRVWINKSTASINEFATEETIKTYPNPAVNQLSFEYNLGTETASASIIDIAGRVVSTKELENNGSTKFDMDITAVPSGMYFLRLNIGEKTITSKFNVQK